MNTIHKITDLVYSIKSNKLNAQGKYAVSNFGILACSNLLRINNVHFYEPYLIFVLNGTKKIHIGEQIITCEPGECLAVSAPSSLNFTNQPDMNKGLYQALGIPFNLQLLKNIRSLFKQTNSPHRHSEETFIHYPFDHSTLSSLKHFLNTQKDDEELLLEHRLTELLMLLAKQNSSILHFVTAAENWGQRVRTILSEDITNSWEIQQVCQRLAVSESKLRRLLQKEGWSFRTILKDLRLSTALMTLLQTSRPIYQVASDCGYESASRFSENFKNRFGLAPKEFREQEMGNHRKE